MLDKLFVVYSESFISVLSKTDLKETDTIDLGNLRIGKLVINKPRNYLIVSCYDVSINSNRIFNMDINDYSMIEIFRIESDMPSNTSFGPLINLSAEGDVLMVKLNEKNYLIRSDTGDVLDVIPLPYYFHGSNSTIERNYLFASSVSEEIPEPGVFLYDVDSLKLKEINYGFPLRKAMNPQVNSGDFIWGAWDIVKPNLSVNVLNVIGNNGEKQESYVLDNSVFGPEIFYHPGNQISQWVSGKACLSDTSQYDAYIYLVSSKGEKLSEIIISNNKGGGVHCHYEGDDGLYVLRGAGGENELIIEQYNNIESSPTLLRSELYYSKGRLYIKELVG